MHTTSKALSSAVGTAKEGEHAELTLSWEAPKRAGRPTWDLPVRVVWSSMPTAPDRLEEPPAAWPSRRYMLAWNDAKLYTEPSRSSAFETRVEGEADHTDPNAVSVYRGVGSWQGSLREVETVTRELNAFCHTDVPAPRNHPFQHFVVQTDLVPVLTEPFELIGEDGTGIRLAPGVAVLRRPDDRYGVDVQGIQMTLPIPHESVGFEYTPGIPFPAEGAPLGLSPEESGRLGETAFGPIMGDGRVLPVVGIDSLRAPLAVVRTGCVEVILRTNTERLAPPPTP